MPEMFGSPCLLRATPCFLWNNILLLPCATAELGKTFLPETTNELQCDTECPRQTFHSITKALVIVCDEEHLREWTRWCNLCPSKCHFKQQIWHTMLPGEIYSEGWWAAYYHIALLRILKILPQNLAFYLPCQVHHPCKCHKDFSDLIPCVWRVFPWKEDPHAAQSLKIEKEWRLVVVLSCWCWCQLIHRQPEKINLLPC